jgi:hypothetical protein
MRYLFEGISIYKDYYYEFYSDFPANKYIYKTWFPSVIMNLRLTKGKAILTLILTIAVYLATRYVSALTKFSKIFTISTATKSIITFVITLVVIYVILSIFQRRRMMYPPNMMRR